MGRSLAATPRAGGRHRRYRALRRRERLRRRGGDYRKHTGSRSSPSSWSASSLPARSGDHRVGQALLRAVVQIADDPPALVVGGSSDARARGGELSARMQVGDRGRHQLPGRRAGADALAALRERRSLIRRNAASGKAGRGRFGKVRETFPTVSDDLTVDEAADALGTSPQTVQRLLREGSSAGEGSLEEAGSSGFRVGTCLRVPFAAGAPGWTPPRTGGDRRAPWGPGHHGAGSTSRRLGGRGPRAPGSKAVVPPSPRARGARRRRARIAAPPRLCVGADPARRALTRHEWPQERERRRAREPATGRSDPRVPRLRLRDRRRHLQRPRHERLRPDAGHRPTGFGTKDIAAEPTTHDVYTTNDEDTSVTTIDGDSCRGGRTDGCGHTRTRPIVGDYPRAIGLAPTVCTAYVSDEQGGSVIRLRP